MSLEKCLFRKGMGVYVLQCRTEDSHPLRGRLGSPGRLHHGLRHQTVLQSSPKSSFVPDRSSDHPLSRLFAFNTAFGTVELLCTVCKAPRNRLAKDGTS